MTIMTGDSAAASVVVSETAVAGMSRTQFPFLDNDLLTALLGDDENFQKTGEINADMYSTLVELDGEANTMKNPKTENSSSDVDCGLGGIILRLENNSGSKPAANCDAAKPAAETSDFAPLTSEKNPDTNVLKYSEVRTHTVTTTEPSKECATQDSNPDEAGKKKGWVKPQKPGKTAKGTKPNEKKAAADRPKKVRLRKNEPYELTISNPTSKPRLYVTTPAAPYRKTELYPVVMHNTYQFRFIPLLCGAHAIDVVTSSTAATGEKSKSYAVSSLYLLVTSPIQELSDSLADYLDSYSWAWGGVWSDDLEIASVEMLGAVDEFFDKMISSLKPLLDMMKSLPVGRSASLEKSREHLEVAMQKAIVSHDGTSIGRAFEAVRELLSSTNMMMMASTSSMFGGGGQGGKPNAIRDALFETAKNFDLARVASLTPEMRDTLEGNRKRVVVALQSVGEIPSTSKRLKELRNMVKMETPFTDFAAYQKLEPMPMMGDNDPGSSMFNMMGMGMQNTMQPNSEGFDLKSVDPSDLRRLPCISESKFIDVGSAFMGSTTSGSGAESLQNLRNEKLQAYLTKLSEPLYGGAFMLGSNIFDHYALFNHSFERSRQVLRGLFAHGCCYVVQSEPDEVLVGTMDHCSCWRDLSKNTWEDSSNSPAVTSFATDAKEFSLKTANDGKSNIFTTLQNNACQERNSARGKRLKDVCRVLKLAKRGGLEFQLGINVGFDETVETLQKYHGTDNWVGKTCKEWWRYLMEKEDFFIMQLWLVDTTVESSDEKEGGVEEQRSTTTGAPVEEPTAKKRKKEDGNTKNKAATKEYSLAQTVESVVKLDDLKPFFPAEEGDNSDAPKRKACDIAKEAKKDTKKPRRTLIGADFCHITVPPSSSSAGGDDGQADSTKPDNGIIYVATRFSSNHPLHRKWQPGFMLAFLAQNFLRQCGFRYWDLGGANGSPMMSYKFVVAEPLSWQEKNFICNRLAIEGKARRDAELTSPNGSKRPAPTDSEAAAKTTEANGGDGLTKRTKSDQHLKQLLFSGQVFSPFIVAEQLIGDLAIRLGKSGSQEMFKDVFTELKQTKPPNEAALQAMKLLKEATSMGLFTI